MGMQIDNVWQFGLRLTNTAFKPALGELRKKHPVFTKIRLFEIQNRIFFWGGGCTPSLDPSPSEEGDTASPHPTLRRQLDPRTYTCFVGNLVTAAPPQYSSAIRLWHDALCALRGIATVSCPSVPLSVRDVDVPWSHRLG